MKIDKIKILLFLIGILLFSFLFYNLYNDFIKDNSLDKDVSTIKKKKIDVNYTLSSNDTNVYKTKYKELEEILYSDAINNSEYAKKISELFIIDLFTLSNKLTSTDIGGLEFIHPDLKENFKENMGNGIYKSILSNIDGKRTQKLPTVSDVFINNVFETKYIYNDIEYPSYLVNASIEYEEDMGYQSKIKLTVINYNNVMYIVKGE